MLDKLKEEVYKANMLLPKYNLVTFTWGNVSAIDRQDGLIVIKPSGVNYELLSKQNMVVVNLNGDIIEGDLNPSSDLATHIELYNYFPEIQSVVHTHSPWAVAFAQAGKDIPVFGTTHADYFYGTIPVTRIMKENEVVDQYERNTGSLIVETFNKKNLDPNNIPGVLVNNHGPFTWGYSPEQAVHNSVVLEQVAKMAYHTMQVNNNVVGLSTYLLDKHFLRKHGENSYYGQES